MLNKFIKFFLSKILTKNLIGVGKTTHTTHDTEDIVVGCVDTDLCCRGSTNSCVGKNKLECRVVNTREVACARWLVLFWAEGEGVDIDTSVWVASVVLVGLDKVEVGSLTL